MATLHSHANTVLTIDPSELDQIRANVLKCQIATYRLLARNLPVPDELLKSCSYKVQLATLLQDHLEEFSSKSITPSAIVISQQSKHDDETPNHVSLSFSSATELYQWLIGSIEESSELVPKRVRQRAISLNPLYIQQERDKR